MKPAIVDNTKLQSKLTDFEEENLGSSSIPLFETGTLVGRCLRTAREEFIKDYFKSRQTPRGKSITIHKLQTPIDIPYPDRTSELLELMEEIPLDSNKVHSALLRARRPQSFYRENVHSTPDTHTSVLYFPDGGWMLVEDRIQSLSFQSLEFLFQ